MKILAIDSSGLAASVAVVEDDCLIAEYTTNYKKTHSQTLLPMLDEVRKMIELDLPSIDAIAVAAGPGSFTGLRIGSATAKGLGFALDKPLIGVPTVDALAMNLYGTQDIVCPIMDARRNQVYTGVYTFEPMQTDGYRTSFRLHTLKPQCVVPIETITEQLNHLSRPGNVIFLGDGVPVYREMIQERVKVPFEFAPAQMNRQRAASVAALGSLALKEEGDGCGYHGAFLVSAGEFNPDYLRKSQAERQREAELSPEGAAGKLPGDY